MKQSLLDLLQKDGRSLTQGEIARGSGLSPSFICKILGGRKQPSLESAGRIAAYLGVSVDRLTRALSLEE